MSAEDSSAFFKTIRLNAEVRIPSPDGMSATVVTGLQEVTDGISFARIYPIGHYDHIGGGAQYGGIAPIEIEEDEIRRLVEKGNGIKETVITSGAKTTTISTELRRGHTYSVVTSRERLT